MGLSLIMFYFQVTYKGLLNPIALNFNKNGFIKVKLPVGPAEDSNKVYIFIRIIDDFGGVTLYTINDPIIVNPNVSLARGLLNEMGINSNLNYFIKQILTGNLQVCSENILTLMSF